MAHVVATTLVLSVTRRAAPAVTTLASSTTATPPIGTSLIDAILTQVNNNGGMPAQPGPNAGSDAWSSYVSAFCQRAGITTPAMPATDADPLAWSAWSRSVATMQQSLSERYHITPEAPPVPRDPFARWPNTPDFINDEPFGARIGIIVGLALAALLLVAALFGGIWFWACRRRRSRERSEANAVYGAGRAPDDFIDHAAIRRRHARDSRRYMTAAPDYLQPPSYGARPPSFNSGWDPLSEKRGYAPASNIGYTDSTIAQPEPVRKASPSWSADDDDDDDDHGTIDSYHPGRWSQMGAFERPAYQGAVPPSGAYLNDINHEKGNYTDYDTENQLNKGMSYGTDDEEKWSDDDEDSEDDEEQAGLTDGQSPIRYSIMNLLKPFRKKRDTGGRSMA